jgi:outer membrane receptor protein involved in Fe transport
MRIQRPGIWNLNPYVNNSDPKNISFGNPDLKVVVSNNFNLNYGIFKPKFNLNANLYYSFVNNSIQQVTTLDNDVSQSTYENIGKTKNLGLYFYGSWNPIMKLRIYANTFGSYTNIQANDVSGMKNSGFMGQIFGGIQYNFPRDLTLSLNGGASAPWITLQGKSSGFHYTALSINKSYMKKKLTLSFSMQNVFEKYIFYNSTTQTDQFRTISNYTYPARNFRISISYKFGEMKQQIKKVQRGIENDDSSGGQSQGGQGGSGGSGGGGQ